MPSIAQDMDLTHERRHLICAGRLFRRADSTFERKGLNELFVLLFDNYRAYETLCIVLSNGFFGLSI